MLHPLSLKIPLYSDIGLHTVPSGDLQMSLVHTLHFQTFRHFWLVYGPPGPEGLVQAHHLNPMVVFRTSARLELEVRVVPFPSGSCTHGAHLQVAQIHGSSTAPQPETVLHVVASCHCWDLGSSAAGR